MSKIELNRIINLHDQQRVRTNSHELQKETKTNYRNILNNLIANIELKTTQKAFCFLCGIGSVLSDKRAQGSVFI